MTIPFNKPYMTGKELWYISQALAVLPQTKPLLLACLPLMANSILIPLLLLIPRLTIEKVYSAEMLGIYTSVTFPSVIVSTLSNAAIVALIPHYAAVWQNDSKRRFYVHILLPLVLALLAGICILPVLQVCGGWVLTVLYTKEISGYINLLSIAVVVSCILACVTFCNYVLIAIRRIRIILPLSGIAFAIVLIGALPFIRTWGIYGAAYLLGLAFAIQLLLQLVCLGVLINRRSHSGAI